MDQDEAAPSGNGQRDAESIVTFWKPGESGRGNAMGVRNYGPAVERVTVPEEEFGESEAPLEDAEDDLPLLPPDAA